MNSYKEFRVGQLLRHPNNPLGSYVQIRGFMQDEETVKVTYYQMRNNNSVGERTKTYESFKSYLSAEGYNV